jgi:simple sugar transport system permease protein
MSSFLIALIGGALRVSTPFLYVSLGECITEKSGRINLGLEGVLIFGAMSGYGASYLTGSPWFGVFFAGFCGLCFGLIHGLLCSLPRVNDIAIGIALMVLATSLAFFIGKPLIQPQAPMLPFFQIGLWSDNPQIQSNFQINLLLPLGLILAFILHWSFQSTRWGLILRFVGDNAVAARALGYPVTLIKIGATALGGFLAGVGGSFLSLYYPGSWNEGLSSGQGLMAVALVIFARWNPIGCALISLIFGSFSTIGPALQSQGLTSGYHLFNAAPYILTLILMIFSWKPGRVLQGAPSELGLSNR